MSRRAAIPVLLLATLTGVPSAAAQAPSCAGLPAHGERPVVDAANVLPEAAETALTSNIAAWEQNLGAKIVLASVPSTGGEPIDGYALRLFNCWGVGDAKTDNGVLLVVAMRERQVRIQTGTGVAPRLTDAEAKQIVDERIVPSLRRGDVTSGYAMGMAGILTALAEDVASPDPAPLVPGRDPVDGEVDPFHRDVPLAREIDPYGTGGMRPPALFLGIVGFFLLMIVGGAISSVRRGVTSAGSGFLTTRGGMYGTSGTGPAWGGSPWWMGGSRDDSARRDDSGSRGGSSFGGSFGNSGGSMGSGSGGSSSSGGSSFGGGSSSGGGASGSW